MSHRDLSINKVPQLHAPTAKPRTPRPAAPAAGRPGVLDARQVLALQRASGNQAVQRLLSSPTPPVPNGSSVTVQRDKRRRASQAENIAKVTALRTSAEARFTLASDYAGEALAVGDLTRDKLSAISRVYTGAYTVFRNVLNSAQQEAQNQQQWTDIVVGVLCGTAAGLAAAFILPSTLAGWFSLTLAEAGTAAASSAGQGVLSGAIALLASRATSVEGKAISSEGLEPQFRELAMWRAAANIYRSGLEIGPVSRATHALSVNLSDFLAEVRVFDAGGESKLTEAKINQSIAAMQQADGQQTGAQDEFTRKLADLKALKTAVAAINPQAKSQQQMERDIWILWMSTLQHNSNILDLDAIEDHIGPKGLGIVDFGIYTSDADENEAIETARGNAAQLRAESQQATVIENRSEQLRILTR
jgi:hypothetical protein